MSPDYGFEKMRSSEISTVTEAAYTILHGGQCHPALRAELEKFRDAAEEMLAKRLRTLIDSPLTRAMWVTDESAPSEDDRVYDDGDDCEW